MGAKQHESQQPEDVTLPPRAEAQTDPPPAPGEERGTRHLETLLVHGRDEAGCHGGPTLPPIALSTAFEHGSAEAMEAAFAGEHDAPLYSRLQNPTVEALEQRVTEICGAAGTLALASGMSAIGLALLSLLRPGDEVIAGNCLFGGTYTLLSQTLAEQGVVTHFVNERDPAAAEARFNARTRAVFLEAIANPAMTVPPLPAWHSLCAERGVPLLLDATLLTPALWSAENAPADVVFFSASKFMAGAASSLAGLVVDTGRFPWHTHAERGLDAFRRKGQGAFIAKLRKQQMAAVGPALSPMTAFLLLTGLETLSLRLERQCANAERVAAWLAGQPQVRHVHYPGLSQHPDHALSRAQYGGRHGSVLSFEVADKPAAFRMLNACRLVRRVTNLGDTRTLAVHPASTIYGTLWPHEQLQLGVTPGMVRLSLGIEHAADLIADLEQALAQA